MSGTTSFRPATIPVLVFWLMAAASSVCLAQGKPSPNAEVKKRACDILIGPGGFVRPPPGYDK